MNKQTPTAYKNALDYYSTHTDFGVPITHSPEPEIIEEGIFGDAFSLTLRWAKNNFKDQAKILVDNIKYLKTALSNSNILQNYDVKEIDKKILQYFQTIADAGRKASDPKETNGKELLRQYTGWKTIFKPVQEQWTVKPLFEEIAERVFKYSWVNAKRGR